MDVLGYPIKKYCCQPHCCENLKFMRVIFFCEKQTDGKKYNISNTGKNPWICHKGIWESGSIATLIGILSTICRCAISFMP
jgi:hypothetical protein